MNSAFDAYLQVVNADTGQIVAFNDDAKGRNSQLAFIVESGVDYIVRATSYGASVTGNYTLTTQSFTLPEGYNLNYGYGLVDAAAAVASADGQDSAFADVDYFGGQNDWGLNMVKAPEAWAQGFTGEGIVVAVIDTGVDYTHLDLDGNIWVNEGEIAGNGIDDDDNGFVDDVRGWDFVANDNNPMDEQGHGTHVAGTIAAEKNDFGVTGVAYNAKIMAVRVLDAGGSGSVSNIAAGIRYAADNGADVINLSLGGGYSSEEEDAIEYATAKGSVVVMAAGNESASQPSYPANLANQWGIAVGAVDSTNTMANFSNKASIPPLDYVVAPGVNIYSTTPGNTYSSFNGTSMATPHVAGVAALMLSANPNLTPAEVESILTKTANPTGITV
ncbi:peptidase S8 [Microcoleus sp. FACHB-53]|nr:peptidase S8 [Microcoleus sp. FACHB-53]